MKNQEDKTESNNEKKSNKGILYIVSTPIGNDEDITLRALRVLKNSDFVICEEGKVGARMLHKLNLNVKMELLNEQNEAEKTVELLKLLKEGKTLSIVSDAGTPVFADPGLGLVRTAIERDIRVIVVPGASSIMTAIVRSGFKIDQFVYSGFLSRDNKVRLQQLRGLNREHRTVVLLETPYRMMPFLTAATEIMPDRKAYIGCNLTMPFESHHYGKISELRNKFSEMKFKGEFVVCLEGATNFEPDEEFAEPAEQRRYERPGYKEDRKPFRQSGGRGFRDGDKKWDRGPRDDDKRGRGFRDGNKKWDRGTREDDKRGRGFRDGDKKWDRGTRDDDKRGRGFRDGDKKLDRGSRDDDKRGRGFRDGGKKWDRGPRDDDKRDRGFRDGDKKWDRGSRDDDKRGRGFRDGDKKWDRGPRDDDKRDRGFRDGDKKWDKDFKDGEKKRGGRPGSKSGKKPFGKSFKKPFDKGKPRRQRP